MIERNIVEKFKYLATKFPVVAVLGPRQSGKTTIARSAFSNYKYISLEDFDARVLAQKDPRAFLRIHGDYEGVILDEIQNVPELLSYIQTHVDNSKKNGYFILTGSQNFLVNEAITQTLAGRIAILTLLPLSIDEIEQAGLFPSNKEEVIFNGCYPRVYDQNILPEDFFPNYIKTYLERDVRGIRNVADLTLFQTFIKLCAGRVGQLVNLTSLGNDCGISSGTAKSWLSLLEASYIVFTLQPHYKNFSKRLVKAPKIYFYDTGLACSLLGISSQEQLSSHYLRGGLFESYIISDIMKQFYNKGIQPSIYFWRDKAGHELDCLIERGAKLIPIEIKSGETITDSYFDGLEYWNSLSGADPKDGYVIYAGDSMQERKKGNIIGWKSMPEVFDKL